MQRHTVVALLAEVYAPDSRESLKAYAVGTEQDYADAQQWLQEQDPEHRSDACFTQLRHALVAQEWQHLQDVHPAWMLDVLKTESPRMISIILRHVPSSHARFIMDRLPPYIKDKMPHFVDAFSVPTPMVQLLRRRFEAHFAPMGAPLAMVAPEFDHIAAISFEDLPHLIQDLGVQELALAFADADARSIEILFNRLAQRDARALRERMRTLAQVPTPLLRDAQYTILEMATDAIPADQFIFEAGLQGFAKACAGMSPRLLTVLRQKLDPRMGNLLQRRLQHKVGSDVVALRQQLVLDRMATLSRAGLIDRKWQLMARDGVATAGADSDSSAAQPAASAGHSFLGQTQKTC